MSAVNVQQVERIRIAGPFENEKEILCTDEFILQKCLIWKKL